MDLRYVIAENLESLKKWHTDHGNTLTSARAIARAANLSKNTVTQLLDPRKAVGERYPTVDTLEAVAAVFDLQAWQLLIPGIDPTNPPVLPVTAAERDLTERFKTLARELERLEARHGSLTRVDRGPNADSEVSAGGPKSPRGSRKPGSPARSRT